MVRMFVRHDVADYDAWRQGYDAFDSTRRSLGVTGQAVRVCGQSLLGA